MSIFLIVFAVIFSAVLAFYFVQREAKRFALAPPTPLVDMDRMYDVVFEKLDEKTGSAVTPGDLRIILDLFVEYLLSNGMVKENIVSDGPDMHEITLDPAEITEYICDKADTIAVERNAVLNITDYAIAYLNDVGAVS